MCRAVRYIYAVNLEKLLLRCESRYRFMAIYGEALIHYRSGIQNPDLKTSHRITTFIENCPGSVSSVNSVCIFIASDGTTCIRFYYYNDDELSVHKAHTQFFLKRVRTLEDLCAYVPSFKAGCSHFTA